LGISSFYLYPYLEDAFIFHLGGLFSGSVPAAQSDKQLCMGWVLQNCIASYSLVFFDTENLIAGLKGDWSELSYDHLWFLYYLLAMYLIALAIAPFAPK
jgi:surface polysaccharide O-acyltransferase-like enzyme